MNAGDAYFLVLYVVSVFQPVTRKDLLEEAAKTVTSNEDAGVEQQVLLDALRRLIRRQLVIEERALLSCTVLGNQRAAKLGLRRVRDKNRLFFLKNLFRREYNSPR